MHIPYTTKLMFASWGRVFLAAMLALYMAGERDWDTLWQAGLAAVIPPVLRWLNPNDPSYGRTNW